MSHRVCSKRRTIRPNEARVQRDANIMRLYRSGMEPRKIQKELGLTRGVVAGVINRNGLSKRKQGRQPTIAPVLVLRRGKKPGRPKAGPSLLTVGTGCLWPVGAATGAFQRFCGCGRKEARPYCPKHCALAYRPELPSVPDWARLAA